MSNNFPSSIEPQLEKLSRFFVWNRKEYVFQITEYINEINTLNTQLTILSQENSVEIGLKTIELSEKTSEIILLSNEIVEKKKKIDYLLDDTERLKDIQSEKEHELRVLIGEAIENKGKMDALINTKKSLKDDLDRKVKDIAIFSEKAIKDKKTIDKLNVNILEVQKSKDLLEKVNTGLNEQYSLVSGLLTVPSPSNEGLNIFKGMLQTKGEYLNFANKTMSLNETENYRKMKSIQQELELIIGFKDISSKAVVGISGGFSSGKSTLINSFMKDKEIELAVGINPVTAIPSYVMASDSISVKGYAKSGGSVLLNQNLYSKMTHEFIKTFDFDLKEIMPFMSISVPMKNGIFDNVCFIDTPGYNPPNMIDNYTASDGNTALEFAQQSHYLIWVIGIDSTGTIPQSDLDFIVDADFSIPIYFVLNKADLKDPEDVEAILQEIEDTLDMEEIGFAGISAYSSIQGKELDFIKQSLFEFIENCNNENPLRNNIIEQIDQVMDNHIFSLKTQLSSNRQVLRQFKSIRLDILERGNDDMYDDIEKRLGKLSGKFETAEIKKHIKDVEGLRNKFYDAIDQVFENV